MEACALPALQADETIYSWCATAHVMSGWPSTERWSSARLGMAHGARQHDFQSYLPHLVSRHLPELTLVDAIRSHTMAGTPESLKNIKLEGSIALLSSVCAERP
jgi:hypothetical protein